MWYNYKTLTVGCPKCVCKPLWKNLHCPSLLFDTPKYARSLRYSKTKSIKKICKKTQPDLDTHMQYSMLSLTHVHTHTHTHTHIYMYANTLWLNKERKEKVDKKTATLKKSKNNNCHFGRIVLTEKNCHFGRTVLTQVTVKWLCHFGRIVLTVKRLCHFGRIVLTVKRLCSATLAE